MSILYHPEILSKFRIENMASAMSKSRRVERSTNIPRDASQLLQVLLSEITSPADPQKLFNQLQFGPDSATELTRFLKAKDRAHRRNAFIQGEVMWFRKYGWFMGRIVGLFGLLVFAVALITRGIGVDFITFAIIGAAGYYVLLMTFSNLRYRDGNKKRKKLLAREADTYQKVVTSIAADLMRKWNISPDQHPIENPRSRAGLEQREDGQYYIMV
jgi:hypothetical protein